VYASPQFSSQLVEGKMFSATGKLVYDMNGSLVVSDVCLFVKQNGVGVLPTVRRRILCSSVGAVSVTACKLDGWHMQRWQHLA
jgi:hypothetical protein